jgi:hypothetical protein
MAQKYMPINPEKAQIVAQTLACQSMFYKSNIFIISYLNTKLRVLF